VWKNTTIKTKGNEMKILKTVIATAIILGSFTAVVANENVDTQIANIKGASAQERVQLMNEFKVKLAAMNAQDRADAISQLRSQVQTQKGVQVGMANAKMQKAEMKMQLMSETDQMNHVQNMNQMNIMNQKQMGDMVGNLPMNPMNPSSMPMSPGALPGANVPVSPGVLPGGAGGVTPSPSVSSPAQPAATPTPTH
jgi:hypothetical protein